MKMVLSVRSVEAWLCAFLIWGSLFPYPFWGKAYLLVMLLVILIGVKVSFIRLSGSISEHDFFVSVFASLLVLIYHLLNNASIAWATFVAVTLFFLLLLNKDHVVRIYEHFRLIYLIPLIPGIILWLLFLVGFDISVFSLGYVNDEIVPTQAKVELGVSYMLFPGSVVLDYMLSWPLFRFEGWFDEPGVIGTVSALILVVEKFDFAKKGNWVIFFAGMISFSLAFYALVTLYAVMNLKRFWKFALLVVLMLFAAYVFIPTFEQTIDAKILGRLEISDDLSIQGDNRMSQEDMAMWEKWKDGDIESVFFGVTDQIKGSSGWRVIFIKSGILGMLIIVCIYGLILIRSKAFLSIYTFSFVLTFYASFLQRPAVVVPFYLFIVMVAFTRGREEYSQQRWTVKKLGTFGDVKC